MRARNALKMAKRYVAEKHPELRDCYIEVCRDGSRVPYAWSFGVHVDEEDTELAQHLDVEPGHSFTGYVFHDSFDGKPVVEGF